MRSEAEKQRLRAEFHQRDDRRYVRDTNLLGCRNMNDTKWREIFTILEQTREIRKYRYKLLGDDRICSGRLWRVTQKFMDGGPAGPFRIRDIEWVEIVGPYAASVEERMRPLGKLPLVSIDAGFRIQAYGRVSNDCGATEYLGEPLAVSGF